METGEEEGSGEGYRRAEEKDETMKKKKKKMRNKMSKLSKNREGALLTPTSK